MPPLKTSLSFWLSGDGNKLMVNGRVLDLCLSVETMREGRSWVETVSS